MITVTRLNGVEFALNAELIERVESTPDTVIFLITGKSYVVREPKDVLIERVIQYRRSAGPLFLARMMLDGRLEEPEEDD